VYIEMIASIILLLGIRGDLISIVNDFPRIPRRRKRIFHAHILV